MKEALHFEISIKRNSKPKPILTRPPFDHLKKLKAVKFTAITNLEP